METKKGIASVSLTVSLYQALSSRQWQYLNYLQLCYENATIISQNVIFKQYIQKLK